MDNLTHSLAGALIGQCGLKRRTGLAMPALIIGANAPDIDVACFAWLEGVEHLAFRRGVTHGPIAWVLLPLLVAGGLRWWDRRQTQAGKRPEARLPVRLVWLYALALIGVLSHPALDWLNVYGVRLLEPFSSRWFYGDVLFIIDPWLWAIMGLGVWLSLRREKRDRDWRTPAQVALGAGLLYIMANGIWSGVVRAAKGSSFVEAIASPKPLAFWSRDIIGSDGTGAYWLNGKQLGQCTLPALDLSVDPQARAFLFWSRSPFAERAPDGSVLLRDARYTDPRARDRFTVALPQVRCVPVTE